MKSRLRLWVEVAGEAGFGCGNVTGMALTPAEKQRRYRERQSALVQANPEVVERALLEEAAQCGQMSAEQRVALADKLTDLARQLLWRAQKLADLARRVRAQSDDPTN
jgi:hypothetical protein